MPANNEYINEVISIFIRNNNQMFKDSKLIMEKELVNMNHFKNCLATNINDLYLTPFIVKVINEVPKNMYISYTDIIKHLRMAKTNVSDCIKTSSKSEILNIYIISFIEAYVRYNSAKRNHKKAYTYMYLKPDILSFMLREYFNSIQQDILEGHSYNLIDLFKIRIKYKDVVKKNKPNLNIRKIDWGASLRNLKEQAAKVDPELLDKYNKKKIGKNTFIEGMKKYNLTWHIYINNSFNHWLVVSFTDCKVTNARLYNITPTNFVRNATRSQIDFTNQHSSVEEIIGTNELGLRDKIRALERVDMNYCLRTYNK